MSDTLRDGLVIALLKLIPILFLGAVLFDKDGPPQRGPSSIDPPPDQLNELLKGGVSEDFERAKAQGIDLRALGYRPPDKD